jgi:hypothetical protein
MDRWVKLRWRGKNATIPTLQSVLERWPQTFFYIDISRISCAISVAS